MQIQGIILADEENAVEIEGIPVVSKYKDMMEYVKKNCCR